MMEDLELKIRGLSFHRKPTPLPAEYRPMYKIALIVLVLFFCCRRNKGSLLKLHLFSWALASGEHMKKLKEYVADLHSTPFTTWGIEPSLNRALQFAVADNIFVAEGTSFTLTDKGMDFLVLLTAEPELLLPEKTFLKGLGKNTVSEKFLRTLAHKSAN